MEVPLIHLIRQDAKKRTTRTWDSSIRNAVYRIQYTNLRSKSGGRYLQTDELRSVIEDAWPVALISCALEALKGRYTDTELAGMIDVEGIKMRILQLIDTGLH